MKRLIFSLIVSTLTTATALASADVVTTFSAEGLTADQVVQRVEFRLEKDSNSQVQAALVVVRSRHPEVQIFIANYVGGKELVREINVPQVEREPSPLMPAADVHGMQ